jgi:restriction system protein
MTWKGKCVLRLSIVNWATTSRRRARRRATDSTGKSDVGSEIDQVEAEAEDKWKDELLDILLKMSPTAFERLAQRLLRESGFTSVVLTLLADLFG